MLSPNRIRHPGGPFRPSAEYIKTIQDMLIDRRGKMTAFTHPSGRPNVSVKFVSVKFVSDEEIRLLREYMGV